MPWLEWLRIGVGGVLLAVGVWAVLVLALIAGSSL